MQIGFRGARRNAPDQRPGHAFQDHGGAAEYSCGHHQRYKDLHGCHAEIPQPGIHAQRIALDFLGEKEADIGHRAGEIAAAEARQKRHQLKMPQGRVGVLENNGGPGRRDQQQCRRQEDRVAPAGEPDEEGRRNSQRGARQARDRGQGEQLGLAEAESSD